MQQTPSLKPNWNLSDLYQSPEDPTIKKDFAHADKLITTLQNYRDRLAELSPGEYQELLKTWEELASIFHKIDLYASMLESTNVGVADVVRFTKKIEQTLIEKGKETLFLSVELAHLPETVWQKILQAPELQAYHHFLEGEYLTAKHTLSEAEEKILADKSQTSSHAFMHLYTVITSGLTFAWNEQTLTLEELLTKFHDPSAAIRKQAAFALHAGIKANAKVTPIIYNTLVHDKEMSDKRRRYDFPEAARFESDEVDHSTVQAMMEAIKKQQPLITRYYNLKKRLLSTDTLYWWDRYAPLPETQAKISPEEAQTLVLDAFAAFSPEMAAIAQQMFTKAHIDWFPSPTKRGGAFCAHGAQKGYPYVLLNYTNTPNDVMTLAHELGHAIHDVLADAANVYFEQNPSLAVAEIASVFSESLLFEKLIASDRVTAQDRLALLMEFIEGSFATVFRQASMFEFEQKVHTKRRTDGELSQEELDTLWHETMSLPFADALTYTDEHKNTWMYVPHIIQTPFYVYSYAFAQLCVLALFDLYQEKGADFIPTYLQLLKTGGSLSPKDNLAQAGLDITQPIFWERGLHIIEKYINQLETEINTSEKQAK